MSEAQRVKKREISVLNWLTTLILASIPVVNLIMFIVWIITSKRATKRNFAIAGLILVVLALVLCVAGIAFFAPQLLSFFQWIRQSINPAQAAQALQSVTPGL